MADPYCAGSCPNRMVQGGDVSGYFVQIPEARCDRSVACNKIDPCSTRTAAELPEDCFILRIGKRGCDGCVEKEQLELELRAPPPKYRETKETQYDAGDAGGGGGKKKGKKKKGKKGKKGKKKKK